MPRAAASSSLGFSVRMRSHDYNDRMSVAIARRCVLSAHPTTGCEGIHGVEVQARVADGVDFAFDYLLQGDTSLVRVPAASSAERADGLWKHTCFEAFIALGQSTAYYELNFAPTGQWAAYRFTAYREEMAPLPLAEDPRIRVRCSSERLELSVTLRLQPAELGGPKARKAAFAAVVEKQDGTLCYWAARHPAEKPDFHHPDAFVLEL